MTPTAYCRARTIKSRTSFYYPILLLSPNCRRAMFALYAFCREVDDIVDENKNQESARKELNIWRSDLDKAFSGETPKHPVAKELIFAVKEFTLPTASFYDIIDGMEIDLNQQRYKDQDELNLYCSKVAVAVGLIAIHIFCFDKTNSNVDKNSKDKFAFHLGMAFQLTNILRDIKEDAQRGRIYIPQTLLAKYGASEADILSGNWSQAIGDALAEIGADAEHHYNSGAELIKDSKERYCLFPAVVMSGIYHRYLTTITQRSFNTLTRPVKLSSSTKLALTIKIWLKERVFPN
ncbi:MAG: presqualene diphosphate synthase HpnD [Magnetococcales bacterium]|nr:presqualene diphosphate synthase HpnD [Magnetococcales bacterium]